VLPGRRSSTVLVQARRGASTSALHVVGFGGPPCHLAGPGHASDSRIPGCQAKCSLK
jgi:hypothetical protein